MLIAFDLDDTLVSEMNYVRSAYHAIARRYGEQFLEKMMQASCPADAFEIVNAPIDKILEIYRTHIP
ncbi:MAG: hypothetical protein K2K55_10190, partial [Duncaniella sp.]|nr:hypothetical protein [Duncaniella sp.]